MDKKVCNRYKQKYHANVPSGWSNDPNGMIFYGGKAHLFYQHYPHDAKWGPMHWGHMATKDFLNWEHLPVALIPNEDYEAICGCCSGNAVVKDGMLYLMYTAAQPDRQRQCLAVSKDGIHFSKLKKNPILTAEQLSDEVSTRDFRDPKIFEKDGWYYCLAGTRVISERYRDLVKQLREKQEQLLAEINPSGNKKRKAKKIIQKGKVSGKTAETRTDDAVNKSAERSLAAAVQRAAESIKADAAKKPVSASPFIRNFSAGDDLSSEAVRHLESELGELTSEAVHHLNKALENGVGLSHLSEEEIIDKVEDFLVEVDKAVLNAAQEHQDEAEDRMEPLTKEAVHSPVISPSDLAVLGGELEVLGFGNIILFRSRDLLNWEYIGKLLLPQDGFDEAYFTLDGVYECPDYLEVDGQEILLASPQMLPQIGNDYENVHSCLYMAGELDFETGRFWLEDIRELDAGFDFYAPQVWKTPDGRKIMIAWKEMWDRTYPTQEDHWVGTYTLPRELSWKEGHLYQTPVRELLGHRHNKISLPSLSLDHGNVSLADLSGNSMELSLSIDPGNAVQTGVKIFKGQEHETVIFYDQDQKAIIVDRSKSGIPITGSEENTDIRTCDLDEEEFGKEIKLQLFLDVSSVEVFVNDGRHVITANVYPDQEDQGIEFFSRGGRSTFLNVTKYDILPKDLC